MLDVLTCFALFVFACGEFFLALGGERSGSRTAAVLLFIPLIACYLALSLASVQRALRATVSTATRASIGLALLVVAIGAYCLGAGLPIVRFTIATRCTCSYRWRFSPSRAPRRLTPGQPRRGRSVRSSLPCSFGCRSVWAG